MTTIAEADVEQAARGWLADLGWQVAQGPDIALVTPGEGWSSGLPPHEEE